jgi:hypothetical protein
MIELMNGREQDSMEDVIAVENSEPRSSTDPPKAYIPACGTLCDAFWWARRSSVPEKFSG